MESPSEDSVRQESDNMQSNFTGASDAPSQNLESAVDVDALRAEVNKWQERVPKLAAALRERTDELSAARDEIRNLKQNPLADDVDARLTTRDELISELESKHAVLNTAFEKLSGQLHSADLGKKSATEEADKWKQKWQTLSTTLDEEGARRTSLDKERAQLSARLESDTQQHEQALEEQAAQFGRETESLKKRNQQLLESMEMANTQIATLGDDLADLIAKVEAGAAREQELAQSLQSAQAKAEQHEQEAAGLKTQLQEAQQKFSTREDNLQIQLDEAQTALDAIHQEQQQDQAEWAEKLQAADAQVSSVKAKLEEQNSNHAAALELAGQQAAEARSQLEVAQQEYEQNSERVRREHEQQLDQEKQDSERRHEQEQEQAQQELTRQLEQSEQIAAERVTQAQEEFDQRLQKFERELAERTEVLNKTTVELQAEKANAANLRDENGRLEECVQAANHSVPRVEKERDDLRAKLTETTTENTRLKDQLNERAALVVELEEEKHQRDNKHQERDDELEKLHDEANVAQQRVTTFQEHNEKLETRMHEQRNLIEDLERELSSEQEKVAQQKKAFDAQMLATQHEIADRVTERNTSDHMEADLKQAETSLQKAETRVTELETDLADLQAAIIAKDGALKRAEADLVAVRGDAVDDGTVQHLKDQLRDLELTLRDRTQEVDEMRWRAQQQTESQDTNSEAVVLVLNQQLVDAREEIERLKEAHAAAQQAVRPVQDDLTSLRGIGEKLAEQLAELGITTFQQIADIDEYSLDAEDHELHHLKARIVRDEWIDQAKTQLS